MPLLYIGAIIIVISIKSLESGAVRIKLKISLRTVFALMSVFIFITEVLTALFVRDNFVRPYIGDVLVTVLICSFLRVIFPQKIKVLPILVFIFALFVEIGQYFDFVSLLGLGHIRFFKILLGATFSFADIICYFLGCLIFYLLERFLIKRQ